MNKKIFYLTLTVFILAIPFSCTNSDKDNIELKNIFGLVIHGGAGNITPDNISAELQIKYKAKLNEAVEAGFTILKNGGTSIDAIERVIVLLENSPLFNAGKGAVFTNNGINELDAAIMNGKNLNAGTVAGITNVKNPIKLARAVMENSEHVMMIGKGAELFAAEQNIELVDPKYFFTEKRWKSLLKIKENENNKFSKDKSYLNENSFKKFGTVGCVALDKYGNLAAGTSTGGMTNKKYGRVGDVPIIGAGTYANNKTCALSATGHGEFFIRNVVTHDISALMEYKNFTISKAANEVIMKKLVAQNGSGGVIGIDKLGNITTTFNSSGMFRAFKISNGKKGIGIFK